MNILAVDPGLSGGLVLLDSNGSITEAMRMPAVGKEIDFRTLNDFTKDYFESINHVFIEHSQPMSKVGAGQSFTFGKNFGIILGWIGANALPMSLVKPKIWQRTMFAGTNTKDKPKVRAKQAALRLWPTHDFLATEKSKVPHNGLIDAALLAEYGRRLLK